MGSGEIGKVYLGNWMRDFSQVGDPHKPAVLTLLNVLSMGEFNTPVTAEQVGGYLPSEHLDRPAGGGSVEDPTATSMNVADWKGLSHEQQDWVRTEQSPEFQAMIAKRVAASDLPSYIEVGKEHAKRELTKAAKRGRGDPDGMAAMGNGLHAIEDYFSHSNFTDACVYILVRDGQIPRESPVYQGIVRRAKQFGYDPSGGVAAGKSLKDTQIYSGAYRSEGNKAVSMLEQLESEVKTGALRKAAVLGAIRLGMAGGGDLGAKAGGVVGEGVVGGLAALGGTLVEGGAGVAHGLASGWERGHGIGAVWDALHDAAVGGVEGGEYGAKEGWRLGSEAGKVGGESVGKAGGELLGGAPEATVMGTIVGLFSAAIAAVQASDPANMIGAAADAYGEHETKVATEADVKAGDVLPNHSELAKDDVDHPLFDVSRSLAVDADTKIGEAMIDAWNANGAVVAVANVTDLVDHFVTHPAHSDWWRGAILDAIKSGGGK
jgi:hypothetical protein